MGINTINPSPLGNALSGIRPQYLRGSDLEGLANKLGMSVGELKTGLALGNSLTEIGQGRGVAMKDLRGTLASVVQKGVPPPQSPPPGTGRLVNFDA